MLVVYSIKIKKEQINLTKQEIQDIFIKSNEIKIFFQQDMAYGDSKGLNIRTVAEKVLRDKVFNIVKNRKYD